MFVEKTIHLFYLPTSVCCCALIPLCVASLQTALVELTDAKAKFGTVVNGSALSSQSKVTLHHNNEIKFGQAPGTGAFRWGLSVCSVACLLAHEQLSLVMLTSWGSRCSPDY